MVTGFAQVADLVEGAGHALPAGRSHGRSARWDRSAPAAWPGRQVDAVVAEAGRRPAARHFRAALNRTIGAQLGIVEKRATITPPPGAVPIRAGELPRMGASTVLTHLGDQDRRGRHLPTTMASISQLPLAHDLVEGALAHLLARVVGAARLNGQPRLHGAGLEGVGHVPAVVVADIADRDLLPATSRREVGELPTGRDVRERGAKDPFQPRRGQLGIGGGGRQQRRPTWLYTGRPGP
jgi:hypothetical protein